MNIQNILDKIKDSSLTLDEKKDVLKQFDKEILKVKEKDPEKYLEFLNSLHEIFEELNSTLREVNG